ncbi:MAG: hypothetical protein WCS69_13780 [Ignavibacteriaceae bacterium]|jgi:hypothetical protein
MRDEKYIHLIIFFFLFSFQNIIPQEEEKLTLPKVNHIASNAFYKGTFTVKAPYKFNHGSPKRPPAIIDYTFHGFEFRVSIILREKGNIPGLPLCVRLISPKNGVIMLSLAEDISLLPKDKILDFSFPVETEVMGLFLMELVSPENQTVDADPGKDIVFYSRRIFFQK